MMHFGLYIRNCRRTLVDLETGEILAETQSGVNAWLLAYPEHTLELL